MIAFNIPWISHEADSNKRMLAELWRLFREFSTTTMTFDCIGLSLWLWYIEKLKVEKIMKNVDVIAWTYVNIL